MQIVETTMYRIGNNVFDSIEKARAYEADCVGEFMENNLLKGIMFSPKDKIKLLENILSYRENLINLLSDD
jgi:hypothetical protein